jgi:hypothetical protein
MGKSIETGITYVVAIARERPVSGPWSAEEAKAKALSVPDGHVIEVDVKANGDVVNTATGAVIGSAS